MKRIPSSTFRFNLPRYSTAKKSGRILRLLSSPEARRAMEMLKRHVKYALGALTVGYIVAFSVMQVLSVWRPGISELLVQPVSR